MATGAEHYLEAERLLDVADSYATQSYTAAAHFIGQAQVHATLALAAATADAAEGAGVLIRGYGGHR